MRKTIVICDKTGHTMPECNGCNTAENGQCQANNECFEDCHDCGLKEKCYPTESSTMEIGQTVHSKTTGYMGEITGIDGGWLTIKYWHNPHSGIGYENYTVNISEILVKA